MPSKRCNRHARRSRVANVEAAGAIREGVDTRAEVVTRAAAIRVEVVILEAQVTQAEGAWGAAGWAVAAWRIRAEG